MKKLYLIVLWICLSCALYGEYLHTPCGTWFATAEFIFWKAHEDDLVYAIDGILTDSGGSSKELEWRWEPGFKVGLGYALPCQAIDIYLNYTWYRAKATGSSESPVIQSLYPTFSPDTVSNFPLSFGSSDWNLHYHTLDFELGNWFYLSNFSFHPAIGVRGAFTRETDFITYNFVSFQHLDFFKQSFDGAGPKLGLNAFLALCNNFALFADGALALIWGKYHVRFNEILNPGEMTFIDTEHHFDAVRTLFDMRLGFAWNFASQWVLKAAWEHRLWLKHNQFLRYPFFIPAATRDNNGDLALYGLDLALEFHF